jgi:hypothetical protein
MTSKERLLLALNKEKADRMPASIHQWQGYHLEKYMGGATDLEAFARVGLDAQIQYFEEMDQFWLVDADYTKLNTPQWHDEALAVGNEPDNRIVHHIIHTPEGRLTYNTAGDRKTTWITEYLIKRDEDIRASTWRPWRKDTRRSAMPASCAGSSGATRPVAGSTPPV